MYCACSLLHTWGSVCLANLGGLCLHSGDSWRLGVPSLLLLNLIFSSIPSIKWIDYNLELNILRHMERGKAGGHEPALSVPPHFNLQGKTSFLNDTFRAFKEWFSKIQSRRAKNIYLNLYIKVLMHKKDDSS